MTFPLVLGFGVLVIGVVLLVALAWALPLALITGYVYAWRRRAVPGSRALRVLGAGFLSSLGWGFASIVVQVLAMSGDAGRGVFLFGSVPLGEPLLFTPALAVVPIFVLAEVLWRRLEPRAQKVEPPPAAVK